MDSKPNFYATNGLDRIAARRRDAAWLEARCHDPGSRLLPVWRDLNLVSPESPTAIALPAAGEWWRQLPGVELALLGERDGVAWFAADLTGLDAEQAAAAVANTGGVFMDLRTVGAGMSHDLGGLCAYARGLMWWHRRHRFCGVCGRPTASADAGHLRRCTDPTCAAPQFPRTDPAVIMLVTDDDRCLLGRQARFPPGMYSTLAGFVEPGETLEDAVAREVFEEAGIVVEAVSYHSSQPWPFPSSLMLGFYARARSTVIRIDGDELEDARWFDRAWLNRHQNSADFRLPRPDSIARRLITEWLAAA